MKKVLAFTRADGSEFIFEEHEAIILCHSLLAVGGDRGWDTRIFRELLANVEAVGVGAELNFDPENVRILFNLTSGVMEHYMKQTQSVIGMLFRWQRKHPHMHIENPPNLVQSHSEHFECLELLCRLVGKLALEVRLGHGIMVHTKKAEEEWN